MYDCLLFLWNVTCYRQKQIWLSNRQAKNGQSVKCSLIFQCWKWFRKLGYCQRNCAWWCTCSNCLILSRVYGCVTNNIGFWIGWLDLLTSSFTISLNHNQLQEFAINLQPNTSSFTDEEAPLLILVLRLSPTELRWLLYPLSTDHAQKTQLFYCCMRFCWGSHVIATQPVHWRAGCCLPTASARTT
jgi:hypothetical protein